MMTGDFVRPTHVKGSGIVGQISAVYIGEDGDNEGEEMAVVRWNDGVTRRHRLPLLTITHKPAMRLEAENTPR